MNMDEMQMVNLDLDEGVDLDTAQREARSEVDAEAQNLNLIAWYDQDRSTGGPSVACAGEVPKCIRDYAESGGAETRVWVNDGKYEFYFSPTGDDVEELDEDWVVKVHEGAKRSEHDNVQGG